MKDKIKFFLMVVVFILVIAAVIGLIAAEIYAWVTYGGKHPGEVPLWALWLMWG